MAVQVSRASYVFIRLVGAVFFALGILGPANVMSSAHEFDFRADTTEVTADTAEISVKPPTVPGGIILRSPVELAGGIDLDTVSTQAFDAGRLWSTRELPADYLQRRYAIQPDEDWISTIQGATVRLAGCSGNFVSPSALMLTSYQCIRDYLAQVDEGILENGFYARDLSAELQVDPLYVEKLLEIVDVTEEVQQTRENLDGAVAKWEALAQAKLQIEDELLMQAAVHGDGIRAEVQSNSSGNRYLGYVYRRLDDVRLIWAPEETAGLFGGESDIHSYPRYMPGAAALRVYEDGEPYSPEAYYLVDPEGTRIGEAVIAAGHPRSTLRQMSTSQIEFARDVTAPAVLQLLERQLDALEKHAGMPDLLRQAHLAYKQHHALLGALNDPYILARKSDADRKLANTGAGAAVYLDSLEVLQNEKRISRDAFSALISPDRYIGGAPASATFSRLLLLLSHRSLDGGTRPLLRRELAMIENQYPEHDELLLKVQLQHIGETLRDDDEFARTLIENNSIEEIASEIVSESALASKESTNEIFRGGAFPEDDPGGILYEVLYDHFTHFARMHAEWNAREYLHTTKVNRLRYEHHTPSAPRAADANGTLRIADGRVEGYPYNGTFAPAFTSLSGIFNQHHSFASTPWVLPQRWLDAVTRLRLYVPLNMVSSTDPGGGMEGGALLNTDLDLVGLTFDVNVEGLVSPVIFDPERMRTVSVDIRGLFETLHTVYGADRVVSEMLDGLLVPHHEDADIPSPTR